MPQPAPNTPYLIRPFASVTDHEQCVDIQRRVWVGDDPVPTNMTIAMERHGGVAVGAFDASDFMLGFAFSFVAPCHHIGANKGLCHHSHMAAVLPCWQGKGLGEALKRVQADLVRAAGFNLMTWTVDPLEAKNARLNIGKLGCICRTYIENCYGAMRDALNAGLPSDRFEVEWWLDRRFETGQNEESRMANDMLAFSTTDSQFSISIPPDFQFIKRTDPETARFWRQNTRAQFQRAFAEGYVVTGFTLTATGAFYTLTKS